MRKSMALQQALGPVFDITFDCEDGASSGREREHAELVAALLNSGDNRFGRIGARLHDVGSPHFAHDVETIVGAAAKRLAYVVLPKVDGVADVLRAQDAINRAATAAGRPADDPLPLHVLIETHGAVHAAFAIAALPQVQCLSFGIMDFVSSHHGAIPASAMVSPGQFDHRLVARAKLEMVAACHAYDKVPSHNVTTEIKDGAVVAQDARRAADEFGFTRMWSIHPGQIEPIVAAFAPHGDDVDEAAAILRAAMDAYWGPIARHGRLHDRASYRYYWTLLQRAKLAGLALPETAAAIVNQPESTTPWPSL